MSQTGPLEIVSRAEELLWAIARCDVEGVTAHRATILDQLRRLEASAAAMNMPDLYRLLMRNEELGLRDE